MQGLRFLSTPSGWRATHSIYQDMLKLRYFYPRPPGGGRHQAAKSLPLSARFLSTPSGWRATPSGGWRIPVRVAISIHALRVEGDKINIRSGAARMTFLSTPSGWRATGIPQQDLYKMVEFLSTPSGWRATDRSSNENSDRAISIHALRVEGDPGCAAARTKSQNFYPRPPGGGRHFVLNPGSYYP